MMTDTDSFSSSTSGSTLSIGSDKLEKYANWLNSIPRDDVDKLQSSSAFVSFLRAFEDLQREHQQIRQQEAKLELQHMNLSTYSLQQFAEELILRIFEHLPTLSLSKIMQTCHRFYILGEKSAEQRTLNFASERVLDSKMKVLRAQEQYLGINSNMKPFVQLPMMGLSMRVGVSNAGDIEYNGLYFCTGCNGNGYVFTKPRHTMHHTESVTIGNEKPLLCVIAKRFSGEVGALLLSKLISLIY